MQTIPRHVGIIMDGNRRWARSKHLPLFMGHREGGKKIEPLVEHAINKGITHLTFWAFSTENWKRDQREVEGLLKVFRMFLHSSFMRKLKKQQVKVCVIGELSAFPDDIQDDVRQIVSDTKDFARITVTFALNYGGRAEILTAVNALLREQKNEVTEEVFSEYLYTKGQPDIDIIIRTGGEKRLSGFLPWQGVYSELYFTDTLWPDFDINEFEKALQDFSSRQRRFGT